MFIISIPLYVDTATVVSSRPIETSPQLVVIKTMEAKQAHIMHVIQHPSVKSINDIKLTLHSTFNIPKGKGNINITICRHSYSCII
jgi:hypothetical protein